MRMDSWIAKGISRRLFLPQRQAGWDGEERRGGGSGELGGTGTRETDQKSTLGAQWET